MAEEVIKDEQKSSDEKQSPSQGIKGSLSKLGMGAWLGITACALVVGLLIGHFAFGGGAGGSALNKTSLTEGELDTVVATYSYKGEQKSVTARQVIESVSTLDASKDDEGNYAVPSADYILYAVRNEIALEEAKSRGISPTDEELLDYAEQTWGLTPDFDSIASTVGVDVDAAKKLVSDSYLLHELQDQASGEFTETEPEYPTEPEYATTQKVTNEETGEETEEALSDEEIEANREAAYAEGKKEYAEYIIALAGDEWDAKNNKWASEDGDYAQALASYEITNDSASFEAAYAAWDVAYAKYSEAQSAYNEASADFFKELYKDSSITILTLAQ